MNVRLLSIDRIANQDIVYGIFYCKYKELKKTKYGDSYINVGLSDNSGFLDSKVWENSEFYHSKFNEGDVVVVKGAPNLYKNKIELNIAHIDKCDPLKYEKYGFDPSVIISKINSDIRFLWKEIQPYFIKTGERKALIKKMYSDYKASVTLFPANIDPAFQVEGSYLNDISKALKMADILLNRISDKKIIDKDLIYSLIFLIRFHIITGHKKDIVYKIPTVFHVVYRQLGDSEAVRNVTEDGMVVDAGRVIASIQTDARLLLTGERVALNIAQRLSGIATHTRAFVEEVRGTGARILDTRKTTPTLRELEKYAVQAGGGFNHRFGLFDAMLLKDNHIAAAGGLSQAFSG